MTLRAPVVRELDGFSPGQGRVKLAFSQGETDISISAESQVNVDVLRFYNGTIPLVDMQTAGISIIPQLDKSAVVIGRFADGTGLNDRVHHGARLSVGELQVSLSMSFKWLKT